MAGTVAQSAVHYAADGLLEITLTATGDSSDGTIPDTVLTPKFSGQLLSLKTNPGATAPTDNYDITIEDGDAIDVLQGVGANRDTSNSEQAAIVQATSVNPWIHRGETLTFKVANQSVNNAIIVARLLVRVFEKVT